MLVIFIGAQFLDGTLTYWGVSHMGLGVEVNALLARLMHAFGAAPVLVGAKLLACACGLILHVNHRHRVLAAAAGTYIGVAVVPWLMIVFAA